MSQCFSANDSSLLELCHSIAFVFKLYFMLVLAVWCVLDCMCWMEIMILCIDLYDNLFDYFLSVTFGAISKRKLFYQNDICLIWPNFWSRKFIFFQNTYTMEGILWKWTNYWNGKCKNTFLLFFLLANLILFYVITSRLANQMVRFGKWHIFLLQVPGRSKSRL